MIGAFTSKHMNTKTNSKKKTRAKALPSKIYEYGCAEPTENLNLVNELLFQANQYRNDLVRIELDRREQYNASMDAAFLDIQQLTDSKLETERELMAVKQALKDKRKSARKRIQDKALTDQIASLSDKCRALSKRIKELKKEKKENGLSDGIGEESNEEANTKIKATRAGKWWGMYLPVEEGMRAARKGKPPRFRRYTGEGKISVQKQGGMSASELLLGNDTQVRLHIIDPTAKKVRAVLRFRIGSNGRSPIWTTTQVFFHRPLPDGCRIKWVYLIRRKIGTKSKWFVQFVVSRAEGFPKQITGKGVAGLDIGWREVPGGIRVAYMMGHDGHQEELLLPEDVAARFKFCNDLQEIRDRSFNTAIDRLKFIRQSAPEWFVEATNNCWSWRDKSRLARLVIEWRSNRYEGDEFSFALMESWRKQDKHLYEWWANESDSVRRHRNQLWREFAAKTARRYDTLIIEDIDHRDFQESPDVCDEGQSPVQRYNRTIVAHSKLAEALDQSGMRIIRVDPKNTSAQCNACGFVNSDIGTGQHPTCVDCGTTWDRDHNSAKNLLAIGREQQGGMSKAA